MPLRLEQQGTQTPLREYVEVPKVEDEWVVLCQALFQSIKEDQWVKMHENLKRIIQKVCSKTNWAEGCWSR